MHAPVSRRAGGCQTFDGLKDDDEARHGKEKNVEWA